jgi:hypothetical protein
VLADGRILSMKGLFTQSLFDHAGWMHSRA